MRVGVAGLGRMGALMAANLARASHDVLLWNRTRATAEDLAAHIAVRVAETPRVLAEEVDVVVTMLADDAASYDVHFGDDGLFAGDGARHGLRAC